MNGIKIIGLIVLLAGVAALVYGTFTWTEETHTADIGPLELNVKEKETVRIPTWGAVAAIVVGGALMLYRRPKQLQA